MKSLYLKASLSALLAAAAALLILWLRAPELFDGNHAIAFNGDPIAHFTAFRQYVLDPTTSPTNPGWSGKQLYPKGSSLVFLDAMPFWAMIVKHLPINWSTQHPEMWMSGHVSAGMILVAAITAFLCTLLAAPKTSWFFSLLVGLGAAFWPTLVGRTTSHQALSLMYLETLALLVVFLWVRSFLAFKWGFVLALLLFWAAGIHPYHAASLLLFSAIAAIIALLLLPQRKKDLAGRAAMGLFGALAACILAWSYLGAFPPPHISGVRSGALVHVSRFYFLFLGPDSVIMQALPQLQKLFAQKSFEGFVFIGTPLALLLPFALWHFLRSFTSAAACVVLAGLLVWFLSFGPEPFGGHSADYISPFKWLHLVREDLGFFRASGRLAWLFALLCFPLVGAWLAQLSKKISLPLAALIAASFVFEYRETWKILAPGATNLRFLDPIALGSIPQIIDPIKAQKKSVHFIHVFPYMMGEGYLRDCDFGADRDFLQEPLQISALTDLPTTVGWAAVVSDEDCRFLGKTWGKKTALEQLDDPYPRPHFFLVDKKRLSSDELDTIQRQHKSKLLVEGERWLVFHLK